MMLRVIVSGMLLAACDSSSQRPTGKALETLAGVAVTRPEFPRATLELGARHYQARCAGCHGARGEGSPHWRDKPPGSAPPLNGSGAEWR